ncbi:hypothetical protein FIU86_02235 [Roseovarius sp. THAF9]|uniref:hypothetical protein n=1 Tax=Roseovarius sp. THAF9 TaxID=2587847 RepID=UPI0012683852|nr:hypothetical protein [Roseovarius sp. THAF9]QFT91643.1 hypothetical protein FIU86_02235 [Roseovarius sp. THAF9]
MKTFLTSMAFVLAAGPVLALSCLRPDVARTYSQASEAEQAYVVVTGELRFDEARLPKNDGTNKDRRNVTIPARLEGRSLSRAGFTTPFARDITLEVRCFGPWCGGARSGVEYLVFLEKHGRNLVMVADPCGSWAFLEPSPAQVKQVETCIGGLECVPLK